MKQFSLEEYVKNPSRKVVTRDGRNVTIQCTNFDGFSPVIAQTEGFCVSLAFHKDGKYFTIKDSDFDLFFAPEKHEGWVNIYQDSIINGPCYKYIYPSEEEAKRNAGPGAVTTTKIEWEE